MRRSFLFFCFTLKIFLKFLLSLQEILKVQQESFYFLLAGTFGCMAVHIGKEIRKRMEEERMKPSVLAKRVHLSPQGLRGVFKKAHIKTDSLEKFCRVLNFNFFTLYLRDKELEMLERQTIYEPPAEYSTSQQVIAAQKAEIDRLRLELKDARTNYELAKILYERDMKSPFPVGDMG